MPSTTDHVEKPLSPKRGAQSSLLLPPLLSTSFMDPVVFKYFSIHNLPQRDDVGQMDQIHAHIKHRAISLRSLRAATPPPPPSFPLPQLPAPRLAPSPKFTSPPRRPVLKRSSLQLPVNIKQSLRRVPSCLEPINEFGAPVMNFPQAQTDFDLQFEHHNAIASASNVDIWLSKTLPPTPPPEEDDHSNTYFPQCSYTPPTGPPSPDISSTSISSSVWTPSRRDSACSAHTESTSILFEDFEVPLRLTFPTLSTLATEVYPPLSSPSPSPPAAATTTPHWPFPSPPSQVPAPRQTPSPTRPPRTPSYSAFPPLSPPLSPQHAKSSLQHAKSSQPIAVPRAASCFDPYEAAPGRLRRRISSMACVFRRGTMALSAP